MTDHRSKGKKKGMGEEDDISQKRQMFHVKPGRNRKLLAGKLLSYKSQVGHHRHRGTEQPMIEKQPVSHNQQSETADPEWERRAITMAMAIFGTEAEQIEHQQLHAVGNKLRAVRTQQCQKLDDIANQIGKTSRLLTYLESGWGTKQEFWNVIEQWTAALGINSDEYKKLLPPLETSD